jgi:hypothetical protein
MTRGDVGPVIYRDGRQNPRTFTSIGVVSGEW